MCFGCWEGAGFPTMVTPQITLAVEAIRALDEINCVGGECHIVTDDWNVDDECLAFCEAECEGPINEHTSVEQRAACKAVLAALRPLSEDERVSALAIRQGWTKADVPSESP